MDGGYYAGNGLEPKTYGYRSGTQEEANKLGLSRSSTRAETGVKEVKATEVSFSKAANEEVKKLGDKSGRVEEKTELLERQLTQAKDQQSEQQKTIEAMKRRLSEQGRTITQEHEEKEQMARRLSVQGRQITAQSAQITAQSAQITAQSAQMAALLQMLSERGDIDLSRIPSPSPSSPSASKTANDNQPNQRSGRK